MCQAASSPLLPSVRRLPARLLFTLLACLSSLPVYAQPRITGEGDPLFTVPQGSAWSALARARIGRREFQADGGGLETDFTAFNARLGTRVFGPLNPWVELGTIKSERDDFDGEFGLDWAAGFYGNLFEYVIDTNAAQPGKTVVRLGGEISYRQSESNFSDADFNWTEWRLAPRITYERDHRNEASVMRLRPEGTALHGALVFSSIDGEFGERDVEENRNFGIELGVGWLWRGGYVTEFSGLLYGDKDHVFNFGIGMHF